MRLSSYSNWTLNPQTFEIQPDQLLGMHLPQWADITSKLGLNFPQPSVYPEGEIIDDFSPNKDGKLYIVPFSQLNSVIKNGDIVVFMERKLSLESNNPLDNVTRLIKQRGWHGEIAFRDSAMGAVQCAPWGEATIIDQRCEDIKNHRKYSSSDRKFDWNLHIFRIKPDLGQEAQIFAMLENGIQRWRKIFNCYTFPPGGDWFLDPVDFKDIQELEQKIAIQLIRKKRVPNVFCMQWVHTVLSLALNVPCNKETLSRLGVLNDYQRNWASTLGFAADGINPLGRLPINPYNPSDVVCAACRLYLCLPEEQVRSLIIPALLNKIPALQKEWQKLPNFTMPPIAPIMEYRKPEHRGELTWEYVATAFDDKYCMEIKK